MLSYSRGPDEPLWEMTIGQVLDRTVERWGDSRPWFPAINRSGIAGVSCVIRRIVSRGACGRSGSGREIASAYGPPTAWNG